MGRELQQAPAPPRPRGQHFSRTKAASPAFLG